MGVGSLGKAAAELPHSKEPQNPSALQLSYTRNILTFRSETGRTMKWAQAHFFVAAGGSQHRTGLGRGVFA
jgi:hypothetical protein